MTKDEKAWVDAICAFGCVVCHMQGHPETPAEPHHLLSGGRRIGHLWTIPLCPGHHRIRQPGKFARHIDRGSYNRAYGGDKYLLEKVTALAGRAEFA